MSSPNEKRSLKFKKLATSPLTPLFSSTRKYSDIFIRPWHDESGSLLALVVHGSGTFQVKNNLNSFGVPGGFFNEASITFLLKQFNIHDFQNEGRFFHSKGPQGSFWIFSAYQNTELEKDVNKKGKFDNLLENFVNYFETDLKDWNVKIAPPMVLPESNASMWNIYLYISHKINSGSNKKETTTTTTTTSAPTSTAEDY